MHSSQHDQLTPEGEELYRRLVRSGPVDRRDLVHSAAAVVQLHTLGLVCVEGQQVTALAPRAPLESLAERHAERATVLRARAGELARLWSARDTDEQEFVQVVYDEQEALREEGWIHDDARAQVRALDTGPLVRFGVTGQPPEVSGKFLEARARGVDYRVVYDLKTQHGAAIREVIRPCLAAGEQARVLRELPFNVMICDDRRGLLSVPRTGTARRHAMLIWQSGLLDSLITMFETYWQMAVPLQLNGSRARHRPDGPETRQLLLLLGAGLTDSQIADELRVSERTVGRRVARLQRALGAQTRFQLGARAMRAGWV